MSGSAKWKISRSDLVPTKQVDGTVRNHNDQKFRELGDMLDAASDRANSPYKKLANRMCRKVLEEVGNIVPWNSKWNDLSVKTDINTKRTLFKVTIKYDGGAYFDPVAIKHIVDTGNKFAVYERSAPVVENDGTVCVRIKFCFEVGDQDEAV